ncbi:GDSL esterase/lipase, partial [Ananas comosus]
YVVCVAAVQVSNAEKSSSDSGGGGGVGRYKKLFVFGDSYVDTGNLGKLGRDFARSWYYPYGITFPGKPSGRFSDGRVFTDFLAAFLGIRSPVPYKYRRAARSLLPHGMNFAVGGAGILDTDFHRHNLSAQITTFEQQVAQGVFPRSGLAVSLAFIFMSGNDFEDFAAHGGGVGTVGPFISKLMLNLKKGILRLRNLGVPKVLVTNMQPIGCTPERARAANYTDCDFAGNFAASLYAEALTAMISEVDPTNATVGVLNVFDPIKNAVNSEHAHGRKVFKHPRTPCCDRFYSDGYCGQIDKNGAYLFRLCENPEDHFYWDDVHLTQAGWAAVFEHLRDPIRRFLSQ